MLEVDRQLLDKICLFLYVVFKLEFEGLASVFEDFQRQLVRILDLVQYVQLFVEFVQLLVVVHQEVGDGAGGRGEHSHADGHGYDAEYLFDVV